MTRSAFAAALLAAGLSIVAAGSAHAQIEGFGNDTACLIADMCAFPAVFNNHASPAKVTVFPGLGKLNRP
jgi:hypothetical protein